MPASFSVRFLLAATALLALFTFSYEAAVRGPDQLPAIVARPAAGLAPADSLAYADSLVTAGPATRARPAAPTTATAPVATVMPPGPRPVFERGGRWARRPRLVHCYVGTVGGQPATALLDWQNPDSVSGTFYLHRRGPAYRLTPPNQPNLAALRPRRRGRGQVLELSAQVWDGGGWWQLHGRPGTTLRATWHDGPAGRPQAIVLHENYAGAVRLAIQTEWVHGPSSTDDGDHTRSSVAAVEYEFLHLPDPAAVPLALRPILSPGPARRRRLLLEGGDGDCVTSNEVRVQLNEAGLLSYQYLRLYSVIGGGDDSEYDNALLDLRTGRWLAPESQLLPHYELALARRLAPHLLHDPAYWQINRDSTWRRQLLPYLGGRHDTLAATTRWLLAHAVPSASTALLTGAGLEVQDPRNLYVEDFSGNTFTLFFSYAELRPLVRPGTPLARMLRARGLW